MPAYDLFPMEVYRLHRLPTGSSSGRFSLPIITGRGCTFKCTFCYRMDKGFRPRSMEGILEEIRLLRADYGIHDFHFSDELLMVSEERTREVCEGIISSGLSFKWVCNGRLNYAKKPLLDLMRRAGCVFINYGIEAMDDETLRLMKKGLKVSQIVPAIEATLEAGISPGFNILFGNLGDSLETLEKGVEFLLKYDDGAQMRTIRPVTPYPGSPLYYHAIREGLLKDCADFYDNKHVNSDLLAVNFTALSDADFHRALFEANRRLMERYFHNRLGRVIDEAAALYLEGNAEFRGFRQQ